MGATTLYWINQDGAVVSVPIADGNPTELVPGFWDAEARKLGDFAAA